jgi:hypothetical protein
MWCVLDIPVKKYIGLEYVPFTHTIPLGEQMAKLENLIQNTDHLRLHYKSVSCSLAHDKFTLVPIPLFNKDTAAKYLNFNIGFENDTSITEENNSISGQIGVDRLQNLDAMNVYLSPTIFSDCLANYYSSITILHNSSPLIEDLLLRHKNRNSNAMFINFQKGEFGILLLEGNQVKLYNSFCYETKEDFVYYVLFTCEQLKLNPETIEMVLLGEMDEASEHYQLLYKYIRNIRLISKSGIFNYCYQLNELPPHYFYNLYCQYPCV